MPLGEAVTVGGGPQPEEVAATPVLWKPVLEDSWLDTGGLHFAGCLQTEKCWHFCGT